MSLPSLTLSGGPSTSTANSGGGSGAGAGAFNFKSTTTSGLQQLLPWVAVGALAWILITKK